MMDLKLLRFLASRTGPMELTTQPVHPDYCVTPDILLVREDGTVHTYRPSPHENVTATLTRALQYCPEPVQIDGVSIERKPLPEFCHVTAAIHSGETAPTSTETQIDLGQAQATREVNIHCQGVSWYDPTVNDSSHHCHILADNIFKHRGHLNELTVMAFGVLPAERLETLSPEQFKRLGHWGQDSPDQELRIDINLRLNRTMADPRCPRPWTGENWRRFDTPHPAAEDYFDDMPSIAVFGTPISLRDTPVDPTQKAAAAHAMYHADSPLVPVQPASGQTPAKAVLIDFSVRDASEPATPTHGFHAAREISLRVAAQGQTEKSTIPAQAAVFGNGQHDASVHFVPDEEHRTRLEQLLFAAYFNPGDSADHHEMDQLASQLRSQISQEVEAAFGDPIAAFTAQLKRLANDFRSNIAYPSRKVSVTSSDGRVTITVSPAPWPTPGSPQHQGKGDTK